MDLYPGIVYTAIYSYFIKHKFIDLYINVQINVSIFLSIRFIGNQMSQIQKNFKIFLCCKNRT